MKLLKGSVFYLEKIVFPLNKYAHMIGIAILAFLMFLTFVSVTARYFGSPVYGNYELTRMGLALLIFFSLGYTQLKKEHISITFLVEKWPARVQAVIDSVTYLVFFLLITATSWHMLAHSNRLLIGNDTTADLGLPLYLFAFISAIGLLLYALTYLLEFLRSIIKVVE